MEFHLAELNVSRLTAPLDDPSLHEFVSVLDAVNAIAEVSTGFIWRLKDDEGRSSSYVPVFEDPLVIVNLSVWATADALKHFVYRSGHSAYLRRRTEWFEPGSSEMVCWWIKIGEIPDVFDARRRLEYLRAHGPSDEGFLFADPRPAPTF